MPLEHIFQVEQVVHGKHVALAGFEFPEEKDGELDRFDGFEWREKLIHRLHQVVGHADLVIDLLVLGDAIVPFNVKSDMRYVF